MCSIILHKGKHGYRNKSYCILAASTWRIRKSHQRGAENSKAWLSACPYFAAQILRSKNPKTKIKGQHFAPKCIIDAFMQMPRFKVQMWTLRCLKYAILSKLRGKSFLSLSSLKAIAGGFFLPSKDADVNQKAYVTCPMGERPYPICLWRSLHFTAERVVIGSFPYFADHSCFAIFRSCLSGGKRTEANQSRLRTKKGMMAYNFSEIWPGTLSYIGHLIQLDLSLVAC